tara:strand:+ start:261 stop:1040 length:780 start_codon:yes stop_codon:yes gene_type:complete
MTEKLTYDPTPADATEFSAEEQDSLKVAEKLGQEEAKQYAGKFENAEELENAYLELQKKLGERDEDTEVDTLQDQDLDPGTAAGVSLITDASAEYFDNDGKLSPETMSKFSDMSTTDLVNAYVALQEANPNQGFQGQARDLTDAEVNSVFNSAGGENEYQRLVNWAGNNLADNKLEAFNSIVNNGDATAIQIAVAGLRSEYEAQEGYEGRMLTGKAARSLDAFRSQAEVVQAMSDPRYERDEAYRQDVYDKLERSNVAF